MAYLRLRRITQTIDDVAGKPWSPLRILDLGSWEGWFALEFASRGARVVSIEGREANNAKARGAAQSIGLSGAEFTRWRLFLRPDATVRTLHLRPDSSGIREVHLLFITGPSAIFIDNSLPMPPFSINPTPCVPSRKAGTVPIEREPNSPEM